VRAFHHHAWLLVAACGGGSPPITSSTPPSNAALEQRVDAAPHVAHALSDADCRAFAAAPAVGTAVVVSSTADCSGIGHALIVLEVNDLGRGETIRTVLASRPLHGGDDAVAFREGDTVVVAIAPMKEPARTVSCVPLPASDGVVRHAVSVEGGDAARRLLGAIVDGSACHTP
jgi:hypothetical protein